MRIVKKYWLPLLALVLAIGLAVWRIGYLERTNTSLSMEIGSREALQNGEPISLENPVVLYKNEPYVPLKEIVERLGGTTDGKTYTLHGAETVVSGVERNGVLYTPFSYLWDSHIPQIRCDKSRNRVIITEAPDEIPLTRRCSGGTKLCADCVSETAKHGSSICTAHRTHGTKRWWTCCVSPSKTAL